jgi:hypothetical protein
MAMDLSWPSNYPSGRREAGDLPFVPKFKALLHSDRRMQVLELRGADLSTSTRNRTRNPSSPSSALAPGEMEPERDGELHQYRRMIFGDVLPKHPYLRTLVFEDCRISAGYLNDFVEASISSGCCANLRSLEFRRTKLDPDAVRVLCRLLVRCDNGDREQHQPGSEPETRVPNLKHLKFQSCGLSTESCNILLASLRSNTTLVSLVLEKNYVQDLSDEAAASLGSNRSLRTLVLVEPMLGLSDQPYSSSLGEEAVATVSEAEPTSATIPSASSPRKFRSMEPVRTLTKALRSNTSLQLLHVPVSEGRDTRQVHPIEDLVDRHNFFLRDVKAGYEYSTSDPVQRRIERILQRNRPYQILVSSEMGMAAVDELALWPLLISRLSDKPEWVYEFVRHLGNVPSLSRCSPSATKASDSAAVGERELGRADIAESSSTDNDSLPLKEFRPNEDRNNKRSSGSDRFPHSRPTATL